MTGAALTLLHWLGFGFILFAVAVAIGAAMARTHFATTVLVAVVAVLVALALLCFGAGEAALAVTLLGVGMAPVLLLGGILLSTPAIRGKRRPSWLAMLAIGATSVALIWATRDAAAPQIALTPPLGFGLWLALLVFVAALVCVGLLGYGERGALGAAPARPER
jgi:hypothetical protein